MLSHCTAGNERSVTHNAICDELVHMARAANLSARREDRQVILGCLPDSKMRMDVIIDNFENGASLSIDVSVIDCRNGQYSSAANALYAGKAANDREKDKIRKYGPLYEKEGCLFTPAGIEPFGRMGKCFLKLFDELALRVHATRDYVSLSYHKQFWKSRIIMAMHRAAACGLKKRMDNVLRRRKGLDCASTGNRCLPCDKLDLDGYGRCRSGYGNHLAFLT